MKANLANYSGGRESIYIIIGGEGYRTDTMHQGCHTTTARLLPSSNGPPRVWASPPPWQSRPTGREYPSMRRSRYSFGTDRLNATTLLGQAKAMMQVKANTIEIFWTLVKQLYFYRLNYFVKTAMVQTTTPL